jgi:AcrR family transcriptional regulator
MNKKEKEIDTRNRLMVATETVFARRGYGQATIDEIIKLADTGKGTLYNYFGNKDNLFYTLVSQKHEKLMEQMWTAAAENGRSIEEKLTSVMTIWVEFLWNNTVLWQVLVFEMTGMNRGYMGIEKEKGKLQLVTRWGDRPPAEEAAAVLRYHRLLAEEAEPIAKVYEEGVRQKFFKENANRKDIAINLLWALAMNVFYLNGQNLDKIDSETLARNFVRTRLYGLAADSE